MIETNHILLLKELSEQKIQFIVSARIIRWTTVASAYQHNLS